MIDLKHDFNLLPYSELLATIQAYPEGISGLIPNHHNKVSITIKQFITFLLVEDFSFNL